MRYDTLILDLDGTLVDSYDALAIAVNHAREALGFASLDAETIKGFVGDGLEALLDRVFAPSPVPADARGLFESRYDEICCSMSRPLDGVVETLATLHELGVRMAVCTNKPTSFSRKIVEHIGIDRLLGAVIGPDLAGARKPDARHVDAAIDAIDGARDRALFVGDMLIDVEAARNAGIPCAAIATGTTDIAVLRRSSARHILGRFSDLVDIVTGASRRRGPVPGTRLVFFDVDSTLATIEGIDELGRGNAEIAALTEAAMNGEIALDEVYAKRLEILRPSRAAIERLGAQYVDAMIPDAAETVDALRRAGMEIFIVSAGIEQALLPLAERLGIPQRSVHAVRLEFDSDGNYAGFDRRSPLTRNGGKETIVMNVRSRAKGKAVFIGDGITDLEAKPAVELFIGFGGVRHRERVCGESDVYLTELRLADVVRYIVPN
ncbi:MAG: HAD-IB family phosphatase [Thermoanaerobaculia bacterium]|jgi:phosphoserine phosphatase